MSIHPSLKTADMMKRHRSVLSRLERVKILQEKGTVNPQGHSVLGLPKVKHLKIRIKKEKSSTAAEGTAPTAAVSPGAAGESPTGTSSGRGTKRPSAPAAGTEAAKPKK